MAKYGPKPKPRGTLQPEDIPPWDCMRCERTLPVSAYYPHNGASYGFSKKCKVCANADARTYREVKGAEFFRWAKILSNFNLTQDEFEELLASQGNKCGMCPRTEPGGKGTWHVDHDHACCPVSGKSCGECVRGILCHHCNLILGHAADNAQVLENGIRYLGGGTWRGRKNNAIMPPSSTRLVGA